METFIANMILFLLVVLVRKLVSGEGFSSFLINFNKKSTKIFIEGLFVGTILIVLYCLITVLMGKGVVQITWQNLRFSLEVFLINGFAYLAVALFEEGLFRGYIMQKLLHKYSVIVAIGVPAIIFGLVHYFSYSNSTSSVWLGLLNATFVGIILSIVVIKTNSLMWVLGYHLAWNLSQTLLITTKKFFINLKLMEDIWTGSQHIPESGIIVTLLLIIMTIYVVIRFYNQKLNVSDKRISQ